MLNFEHHYFNRCTYIIVFLPLLKLFEFFFFLFPPKQMSYNTMHVPPGLYFHQPHLASTNTHKTMATMPHVDIKIMMLGEFRFNLLSKKGNENF